MADSKRRPRSKRKSTFENKEKEEKKVRRCEKAGCFDVEPSCCLLSCDSCTKSGYTSRWYHMSLGEHFCNNCFDNLYRPGRDGNAHFSRWSNEWGSVARGSKPNIKLYVANELLPYWLKCTKAKCEKWRMIQKSGILDSELIKTFQCSNASDNISCDSPENKSVALVFNPYFSDLLTEAPLLKRSPAGSYLKRYLPEDVGMCPISCEFSPLYPVDDIKPFCEGQCGEASIWPKPDSMDEEETLFVSNKLIPTATYLGMRNLIVAVWNLSPQKWLDVDKINIYVISRGLVRIYLLNAAKLIIKLLTKKAVINYGILENPSVVMREKSEDKVLIIGAGMSGLAAGRHLYNLGINVTIFERSSKIGGRIEDNQLVSKAFFIQGILNNPFRILALQTDMKYKKLLGEIVLYDAKGKLVPENHEKMMQCQLRGLAQGALESTSLLKNDDNWYNGISVNYDKLPKETKFAADHNLFLHLLCLLEFELGADMRCLSLSSWEDTVSLKGANALLINGVRPVLEKLAENINIMFNNDVKSINYNGDKIKVSTSNEEFLFSKVLITVPLPVLRKNEIKFTPLLPEYKQTIFNNLGDYNCAKLIMQFPKRFWIKHNLKTTKEFSVISEKQLFSLFFDVTSDEKNSTPTLIAMISSETCELLKEKSDKDIMKLCHAFLVETFCPKKPVPEPSKWYLTNFRGPNCVPYGSYLKVGCKSTAFDDMAKNVDDKIFFAGEATFRNTPSCLTAAYLSGLREAAKISKYFEI